MYGGRPESWDSCYALPLTIWKAESAPTETVVPGNAIGSDCYQRISVVIACI